MQGPKREQESTHLRDLGDSPAKCNMLTLDPDLNKLILKDMIRQ